MSAREDVIVRRGLKLYLASVARGILGPESRFYQDLDIALHAREHVERAEALAREVAQLQAGNLTREVAQLQADNLTREVAQLRTGNNVLLAEKAALLERVNALESHNETLTKSATGLASELQKKAKLDYQLLMTQQNILAGLRDAEPRFMELYKRCREQTMTSAERLYALYKSIEYLVANNVPGDIAETGVWLGGSCMLAAETLLSLGDRSRRILLYDTFEGHPEPDPERDIDLWGNRAHDDWERHGTTNGLEKWGYAALDVVEANMAGTGYPGDKLVFVKGKVEETVPLNVPAQLALLRLDTDWYESTKVGLEYLYPKLVSGGVLIIDDYGHYQGQRQAVDEYFAALGERPLFHRIDYSCRVTTKK